MNEVPSVCQSANWVYEVNEGELYTYFYNLKKNKEKNAKYGLLLTFTSFSSHFAERQATNCKQACIGLALCFPAKQGGIEISPFLEGKCQRSWQRGA